MLEFEFGTNFSSFSQRVSNVISPLLSFEVMTAFFLESSFLGIMLFGWNKVSRQMHFLATCLVTVGTILSAFWILAANSWMQTPAGYSLVDGTFMITDFTAALFNPSALVRIAHMTVAALETSVFVVAGVSSYFLLKGRQRALFRPSLGIALVMAALFAPLQVFVGDQSGQHVVRYQPAKAAAIEAHWETNTKRRGALCPGRSSRHAGGEECLRPIHTERPKPAGHSHASWPGSGAQGIPAGKPSECLCSVLDFRVMVAIGFIFLMVMAWAFFLWRKGTLYEYRPFLWTLLIIHPLGFFAVETGWITTERGRQPWLVYNCCELLKAFRPFRRAMLSGRSVCFCLSLRQLV